MVILMKTERKKSSMKGNSKNFLITGPPRSGKSTVIKKALSALDSKGLKAGGIYCPEIRENGKRVGFKIVDIMTGNSKILAHVEQPEGPKVSKYRVNVPNVDSMSKNAISRALDEAEIIVIDEIAPMEVHSEEFRRQVKKVLDSQNPVIAAIHRRSSSGFIGRVKKRPDSKIIKVTEENREGLPSKLESLVQNALK